MTRSDPATASPDRVVIVLEPGRLGGRLDVLARWARRLLPAAVLVVGPAVLPADIAGDAIVITVNADDVESGPLSFADALTRAPQRPLIPRSAGAR